MLRSSFSKLQHDLRIVRLDTDAGKRAIDPDILDRLVRSEEKIDTLTALLKFARERWPEHFPADFRKDSGRRDVKPDQGVDQFMRLREIIEERASREFFEELPRSDRPVVLRATDFIR
jgi:hypothetical protein